MSWNNAIEKRKFDAKEKELMRQYREAGMSEELMKELYEFDWEVFKSDRRYNEHTQSLEELLDAYYDGQQVSLKRDMEAFTVLPEPSRERKLWWIDEIEDEKLVAAINTLDDFEKELIHLSVFEGRTGKEMSSMMNMPASNIRYHLNNAFAKLASAMGRPLPKTEKSDSK